METHQKKGERAMKRTYHMYSKAMVSKNDQSQEASVEGDLLQVRSSFRIFPTLTIRIAPATQAL